MVLLSTPFRTSAALLLASLSTVHHVQAHGDHDLDHNPTGCLTDAVETGKDYFPHKVEPSHSEHWSIEYFDTYKIVQNTILDETYLLYQCGTELPASLNTADYNAVLSVPVENVGLTQTTDLTFMEQLNNRDKIRAFLTDPQYIWSPCFAADVEQGTIALLETREDGTPSLVGQNPPAVADMMAFAGKWDSLAFEQVVKVSENEEKTNAAIFEWVKFFSVFFNQEELANQVFDAAEYRFQCIKKSAAAAVSDAEKPTLLWGRYSDYCKGWDVGECDNYYCEFADVCNVNILSSSEGSNTNASNLCGGPFMTTEEFVAFGKDADYWFIPDTTWNVSQTLFGDELAQFKSVMNQQVYDYQGQGQNAWFERRLATYYDVADDMCSVVGSRQESGLQLERRTFWRNVMTETVPPDGADAECTVAAAANILADTENDCAMAMPESDDDDDDSSASWVSSLGSVILMVAASAGMMIMME